MTYWMESERLGFSVWRPEDLGLAEALWGDPEVTRYITASGRMEQTDIEARLQGEIGNYAALGIQYFPVFLKGTDEFAGCCGLRPYDAERGIDEFGVHLLPRFWGRGLAGEACRRVARYAFDTLRRTALFAGHNPNNAASAKMLKKAGFRYSHDAYYAPTGLMHPSYFLYPARIELRETGGSDPEFLGLVALLDSDLAERYGEESRKRHAPHNRTDGLSVVLAHADGAPAACGAIRVLDGETAELKRIFACPEHRRVGLARRVIGRLEELAKARGCRCMILETGSGQPEAVGLYRSLGYRRIPNYGPYIEMKGSICMEKELR